MNAAEGLILDPETHVYTLRGNVVAGVTDTIKPLAPDYDAFPSQVARDRGQLVHRLCAVGDGATEEWPNWLEDGQLETELWPYVAGWLDFLRESEAVVHTAYIERLLYHEFYGYAGTVDRVVRMKGRDYVLDIKTGAYHPSHILQVAAYREALIFEGYDPAELDGAINVYVSPGGYTTRIYKPSELSGALKVFLALRSIAEWRKEHDSFAAQPQPETPWVPLKDDEEFQI